MEQEIRIFQSARLDLPATIEPTYSNYTIVRFCASEVLLDFARVLPGVKRFKVLERVVLSPYNATQLRDALTTSLARYTNRHGRIRKASIWDAPHAADPSGCPTAAAVPIAEQRSAERGCRDNGEVATGGRPTIEVPASLPANHCNFTVIASAETEFILDFARLRPNAFKTSVAARLIMSPLHAETLRDLLCTALERYETKHGAPRPDDQGERELSLRNTTAWGLSVPFAMN